MAKKALSNNNKELLYIFFSIIGVIISSKFKFILKSFSILFITSSVLKPELNNFTILYWISVKRVWLCSSPNKFLNPFKVTLNRFLDFYVSFNFQLTITQICLLPILPYMAMTCHQQTKAVFYWSKQLNQWNMTVLKGDLIGFYLFKNIRVIDV